ncbi:hypothetical protein CBM2631_B120371 [Cupriavidus taiwanensis]|nr:hypothetical protein CBM2621_B140054 [Cupriavidus taiwanensis]SPA19692.1 hypothetical protein CBM2631_B120371 [Cupriavidus taiwanensis]SPD57304.1 protein of unknown function [Cupriavidus taiwanensis]
MSGITVHQYDFGRPSFAEAVSQPGD